MLGDKGEEKVVEGEAADEEVLSEQQLNEELAGIIRRQKQRGMEAAEAQLTATKSAEKGAGDASIVCLKNVKVSALLESSHPHNAFRLNVYKSLDDELPFVPNVSFNVSKPPGVRPGGQLFSVPSLPSIPKRNALIFVFVDVAERSQIGER